MRWLMAAAAAAVLTGCGQTSAQLPGPAAASGDSVDRSARGVTRHPGDGGRLIEAAEAPAGRRSEAAMLLRELAQRDTISAQARATRSRYHSAAGRKLYEDLKHEEAARELERALELDPSNAEAARYLRLTRNILGVRKDRARSTAELLINEKKVKIQELHNEIRRSFERGNALYRRAQQVDSKPGDPDYEEKLHESVKDLERSIRECDRTLELIRWMPY